MRPDGLGKPEWLEQKSGGSKKAKKEEKKGESKKEEKKGEGS